jgi:hypothetical protein
MYKKLLSGILALTMVCGSLSIPVSATEGTEIGGDVSVSTPSDNTDSTPDDSTADEVPETVKLSDVQISGLSSSYTYRGTDIKPTLKLSYQGTSLIENTDYTVSFSNNLNVGTASVTITGAGNYTGTVRKTFKITAANISNSKVSGLGEYYKYTGKARTPSMNVVYNNIVLKKNTDYTVSYKNNTKIGTATVTVKGKGNFKGQFSKTFKIVRKGWYKENGYTYYYNSKGKKVTGLYKLTSGKYYFDSNGVRQTGWIKLNDQYYFFNRSNGKQVTGKTVDGIKITGSGTAEKTQYNISKIDTMITAHNLVNQITKPTDSLETKRLKCFKWVFQFPYHRFRKLAPIYKNQGWEITFANDIFKYKSGCCVSEASAVAFLFHECGYETVYVAHDTGHAWVEMNGRVYDPLFAEARDFNSNYNVVIPKGQYRSNPVQRRKI